MIDTSEWPTDDPWRFPSNLYGNHKATHSWWRKVLKDAWKAQSWSAVLDTKPMIDVRNTTGDVVYEVSTRGVYGHHRSPDHWFLSWAADDRPYDDEAIQDDPAYLEIVAKDQELLKHGLRYLWFTIAHLGGRVELPQLFGSPQCDTTTRAMYQSIAEAICFWLPEILSLHKRLTMSGFPPGTNFMIGVTIPRWLISFRQNLASAGFVVPVMAPEWEQLKSEHAGDPLAFLLMLNLIEKDGGRFRPSSTLPKYPIRENGSL